MGLKKVFGGVWEGLGPDFPDDGKHLRCREFRLSVEGWWGVRGEEGGKKFVSDCLGWFGALSGTE